MQLARTESEADREVVLTRVINAPARLLFLAYTKPEHVMKWFGPPGYPLTTCEMDFRPGGTFHFAMTGPDGEKGPPFGGTYLEIVPNRRIVYDNGFDAPPAGMPPDVGGRMTVTVTFDEQKDGQTKLTIRTLFESVKMKNAHCAMGYEHGLGSTIPQLEAVARSIGVAEGAR